jgi:hypothetical protein
MELWTYRLPPFKFERSNNHLHPILKELNEESVKHAAEEAKVTERGSSDFTVVVVGSFQKRDHSSIYFCIIATALFCVNAIVYIASRK